MKKYTIISLLLIIFLIINMVYGQAARTINYQGQLSDNSVLINGNRQMTFKIYDSMTGGTVLWEETYTTVAIFNGLFNVSLGSITPINLSFDRPYWLAIHVGAGDELTPRISLGNVGNSFHSFKADSAFNIPDNMITTAKIVDEAITQAKLDPGLSIPPGGTAGGDLIGTYPNPLVAKIQGQSVSSTAPGTNQVLKWNGSSWAPGTDDSGGPPSGSAGGDLTGTYPDPAIAGDAVVSSKIANGTIIGDDLADNAVSTPKIANGAVTQPKLDPGLSLPPGGTADGDLAGTYPNPTVDGLRGRTVATTAPSTGQVLEWNGSSWAPGTDNTGGTPSGTAGGDLTGTYPNPTVDGLRGRTVASTAPSTGQVLEWNGSAWAPGTDNAGGNTLDQAYDQGGSGAGRTINANAGAVNITGSDGLAMTGPFNHSYSGSINGLYAYGTTNYALYWLSNYTTVNGWGLSAGMGSSSAPSNSYGVMGWNSGSGYGVYGWSIDGYGAYGENNTNSNYGYLGGPSYGAYGESSSTRFGYLGGSSYGAYAQYNSSIYARIGTSNAGVWAYNGARYGLLAYSSRGVEGYYDGSHWGFIGSSTHGGYFVGNVQVSGTLSKTAGSFKIDHPLDPANKYLYHSFVESPDMKNIYDGVINLDAGGEAIVELPDWFEALNKDFRYQLTAIGAPGPNLYIAEEISNNQFKIAGGAPGMKVSWHVTGIRIDAYANANRIKVEEDKKAEDRGKYLHPELYGLSNDMRADLEGGPSMTEEIEREHQRIIENNRQDVHEQPGSGEGPKKTEDK